MFASDDGVEEERALASGAVVGRFEIVRELGRGGFGVVHEAWDRELRRPVAFKLVRPPPRRGRSSVEDLVRREADAIALLQHPNIVTLHDVGRCEAGPFLVLELLRGETLAARLGRGALPVAEAARVAVEVGRALVHAHGEGVLHRDLKPSNVFLTRDGGVKVLDFGLAHVFGGGGPARSGTPGYMAPEQREGRGEDARTDVYALAVVLAEAIAGARPPDTSGWRLRGRGVPPALAALVLRATAASPGDRPDDAAAFVDALLRVRLSRARRAAALVASALSGLRGGGGRARPAPEAASTVEAYRHLFLAEERASHPVFGQDCADEFRKALALDPTLPAAHYGLAVWVRRYGGTRAAQRAAIDEARRHAGRATELQRRLIEALALDLHDRGDDAIALYARIGERWPEDARSFYERGDILRHRDELAAALPCFERVAALDESAGWALAHIVEALGALGDRSGLERWIARWEAAPDAAKLHAISLAHGWLGDLAGAREAAERAIALGAGLTAQQDLLGAAVFAGDYAAAERTSRLFTARSSAVRRIGFYGLAAVEAYRGRRRAGLAFLDALLREIPSVDDDALYRAVRADYLAGGGDADAVFAEVERLRRIDPRAAAEHAVTLAWLGDLARADALARDLLPGSVLHATFLALVGWHRGERRAALDALRAVVSRTPVCVWRIAPVYLLAELASEAREDDLATEALERFRTLYVPRMMWRSWAHPRSLVLSAAIAARRGESEKAEASLARFEREWAGAEPGDPLVARANSVRERLGAR
jgi:tetratricopeptide (TPR) repeat protein